LNLKSRITNEGKKKKKKIQLGFVSTNQISRPNVVAEQNFRPHAALFLKKQRESIFPTTQFSLFFPNFVF